LSIAENLAEVRRRVADAARRARRDPSDVTLVAVSKTFPVDRVREAHAAGQRDFGENKVQEGLQKLTDAADIPLRWHLIGHLQSNKAKKAATGFACVHSVDSLDLLRRLDEGAAARPPGAAPLEVLIQVDFAGEATKFGAAPDEALRIVDEALQAKAVASLVRAAPPVPGYARARRRAGGRARAALDGHEPRLRGRHRRRGDHRPRRHGDFR
jgi:pyridoxal phosphate enzyme (YggS family)